MRPAIRFLCSLLLMIPALPCLAQEDVKGEIEYTRAQIQADRQAITTAAMQLSEKEGEAFWPVYRDYRQAMNGLGDRTLKLIQSYASKYESLTDPDAIGLVNEYLAIKKDEFDLKKKWVKEFEKVLPARKVARFCQVENKLDAIISYELAAGIPMVK